MRSSLGMRATCRRVRGHIQGHERWTCPLPQASSGACLPCDHAAPTVPPAAGSRPSPAACGPPPAQPQRCATAPAAPPSLPATGLALAPCPGQRSLQGLPQRAPPARHDTETALHHMSEIVDCMFCVPSTRRPKTGNLLPSTRCTNYPRPQWPDPGLAKLQVPARRCHMTICCKIQGKWLLPAVARASQHCYTRNQPQGFSQDHSHHQDQTSQKILGSAARSIWAGTTHEKLHRLKESCSSWAQGALHRHSQGLGSVPLGPA